MGSNEICVAESDGLRDRHLPFELVCSQQHDGSDLSGICDEIIIESKDVEVLCPNQVAIC